MKVAVAGCIHGDLNQVYSSLHQQEIQQNVKADLLIICGDVLAVRNPGDIEFSTIKQNKENLITCFYEYYSGEKVAPILTLFVGGKYEAIKYNSELPYGGWVCPNIYYMGYSNVIQVAGLRIAGLSGFFDPYDYQKGHFESPPYDLLTKASMCHIKKIDVLRLKIVKEPIDIFVSYEWPTGVHQYGEFEDVLDYKPKLRAAMNDNLLGNFPSSELLNLLKPTYWFAGALHCKFKAIVNHNNLKRPVTKFLALDKCQEGRKFLKILDIHSNLDRMPQEEKEIFLEYDPEWLSILQNTNDLHSTEMIPESVFLPQLEQSSILQETNDHTYTMQIIPEPVFVQQPEQLCVFQNTNDHTYARQMKPESVFLPDLEQFELIEWVFNGNLRVPENFLETAPTYRLALPDVPRYINPQTVWLCEHIGISDPLDKQMSSIISSEKVYDIGTIRIGIDDPLDKRMNYENLSDTSFCEDTSMAKFNSEYNSNVSNFVKQMQKLTKSAAELNQKFIELNKLFVEVNTNVCNSNDIKMKDDFSTNSNFAEVSCKNAATFDSEGSSLISDVNATLETCDDPDILILYESRENGCKDIEMKDDFSTNSNFAEVSCKNAATFDSEGSSLRSDVDATLATCDDPEIFILYESRENGCKDIEIKDDFSTNSNFAEVSCINAATFDSEGSSLRSDVNVTLATCDDPEILKMDDSKETDHRVKPEKLNKLFVEVNKNVCKGT